MAELTQSNIDTMVGKLILKHGLATHEEVEQCRKIHRSKGDKNGDTNEKSLVAILIKKGVVTKRQIERLKPEILDAQTTSEQIPGYQVIEKLGAGAMATVYKAKQLSLDREVAIKILPQKFTKNKQFVERFYAEGRAAAKLNHPNIVQAFDVGLSGAYHYFVMEYVEGRTVYDDIMEKGAYNEADAIRYCLQVAYALEHAHAQGFIHRDVKPKNIMIASSGAVKLADMGLARAVSDREAAEAEQGKAFGTPYYISPEQIRGELDIDFRADIYSLGCTFYHMVVGRVPFEGPNPSAVMHKHLKSDPVPVDHINPNLSSGIAEVIEVCIAKDRDKRYVSTTDLISDLDALMRGEPPLQARRKFDLKSLAEMEDNAVPTIADADSQSDGTVEIKLATLPLFKQPLFWIAVSGWSFLLIWILVSLIT